MVRVRSGNSNELSGSVLLRWPIQGHHRQENCKWNTVVERTYQGQVSRKVVTPVNRCEQKSEYHQKVMHATAAFVVKDAPERH